MIDVGKIEQLTTTTKWFPNWDTLATGTATNGDTIVVNCDEIFDLDYEDYLGIAHQIMAEEYGYETF